MVAHLIKEFPHFLCNLTILYHVHKRQTPDLILSQTRPTSSETEGLQDSQSYAELNVTLPAVLPGCATFLLCGNKIRVG